MSSSHLLTYQMRLAHCTANSKVNMNLVWLKAQNWRGSNHFYSGFIELLLVQCDCEMQQLHSSTASLLAQYSTENIMPI